MLVYVSYYTTSYTTTCGTFIDRFTVRKKNGVGLVWLVGLVFFFHLDNKISCFLFLFRVFIQTVVQPTWLSPGSRMSVHPLPVLSENPFPARIPYTWVLPHPNRYGTTLTRGHALCAAHLHFIPPHSSSSSSSSSPSDRDVQGRIWR